MVFKWVFSVLAERYKQNRVAERKNRTLIEAARTMLADSLLPTTFWAEAVNTACYVQNRVLVPCSQQAPYELLLENAFIIDYILLPLMLSNSPLSSSNQSTDDKDADEVTDKGDDDVSQRNCQEKKVEASNKEDDHHVQDFRAELDNFLV
ncbi:ribonuclease H-like domain-containing protein [Tanacetum coccineum]